MATETPGNGQTTRDAAAQAVAPDALTAEILAKHSAGQPLTPQESGKMGAWRARLNRIWAGKGGAAGPAAQSTVAAPGNAARVATVASGTASGDRLEPVPVNPRLAKLTAASIINKANTTCVRWIEGEAIQAGAVGKTLDDFRTSAALSKDDRELISELTPELMAEFGISPRWFALGTVGGVLGLHVTNLWLCVNALREMRKEKPPEPLSPKAAASLKQSQPLPPQTTMPQISTPKVERPKGAPPQVT